MRTTSISDQSILPLPLRINSLSKKELVEYTQQVPDLC
jgi:hypothetical protein